MSLIRLLAGAINAGLESVAANQMQQQPRTAKRRKDKEECTPCAAMAGVDSMRKQLGYKVR